MTKKIVIIGVVLLLLAVFLPQKTEALTLSPPLLELGADPGGPGIISKIKVINETQDTTTLFVSAANFTARDESGNPFFLFEEEGGLASWIEVNAGPIVLLPGERQDVPFTINVPEDADPGGHYAGIFFSSVSPQLSPEQDGQVGVVAKLGSLILLKVAGEVTMDNAVQEFHILNDQTIFTRLPVHFWYRLYNNGNIHIRPEGEIEIKNIFGLKATKKPDVVINEANKTKYQYQFVDVNPSEGAVLPNSIRKFEPVWQKSEPFEIEYKNFFQNFFAQALAEYRNFAFGRYTATLKFDNNIPDASNVEKISFWVFPWHFLVLAAIIVIIAILIIIFIFSRYNRLIIKKARLRFEREFKKQQSQQARQQPDQEMSQQSVQPETQQPDKQQNQPEISNDK